MTQTVTFPEYSGVRCLMMPYIQGDPDSVPDGFEAYHDTIATFFLDAGEIGFLTIDESPVAAGTPHRGDRAKFGRALHTEAGLCGCGIHRWGTPTWGGRHNVTLDPDTKILLANSIANSCAIWDVVHPDTSTDGDIGDMAHMYPYDEAEFMAAGEARCIGILTPHESIAVQTDVDRQFLRIMGSGVHGREPYFTTNPLLGSAN